MVGGLRPACLLSVTQLVLGPPAVANKHDTPAGIIHLHLWVPPAAAAAEVAAALLGATCKPQQKTKDAGWDVGQHTYPDTCSAMQCGCMLRPFMHQPAACAAQHSCPACSRCASSYVQNTHADGHAGSFEDKQLDLNAISGAHM